jgi:putative ABC transport system permease protein
MNLWPRLKYLLLPSYRHAEENDMQQELESFRAMAGPRELGNLTRAAENARQVWGWTWLNDLRQDLRYSVRTLIGHPSVTIIAVLSIAIGIGANTMIFSLVNALLFPPIPFPEPGRLVIIASLTRGDCISLRERTNVFEHFGCYVDPVSTSLAEDDASSHPPERIRGQWLTAGMARALGVEPLIGRWFTDEEERQSADSVILIGERLWQTRFEASRNVLGKTVRVDSELATIIGVAPDQFEFLDPNVQYWAPLRHLDYGAESLAPMFGGIARLRSDVDIRAVQAEMDVLAQRSENRPAGSPPRRIDAERLNGYLSDRYRDSALTLQGIVLFVLLIACANVAGLLLALGVSQRRELAVRVALGSGRWRIIRHLLMHGIVLSCLSSALVVAIGWWGIQALLKTIPAGLPRTMYTTPLDSTVLLFTSAVALIAGVLAGLAPAIQLSRARPQEMLQQSSRSVTANAGQSRLRSAFVAVQIALAFVLIAGAALMINSLIRMVNEDIGFSVDGLLAAQIDLPESKFRRPTNTISLEATAMEMDASMRTRPEQIRQNLEAISGVISASAIAVYSPLSGSMNMPVRIGDRPEEPEQRPQFLPILAGYFKTLQVPVIQGREFTPQDNAGAAPVAMINDAMARRVWPDENALGKYVQVATPLLPNEPPRAIVGIVHEVEQYLGQQDRPQLYIPYTQLSLVHDERLSHPLREFTFVIRTFATVPQMTGPIREAVARADASQAVSNVRPMRQAVFGTMPRRQTYAGLVATFGMIAVGLALAGIYGVISQIVNQRTNEIGIRMALGADATHVRRLILRYGTRLIAIGLILGIAGAVMLTRVIRTSLFGISPTDPLTFVITLALLGATGLTACYVPARRASRIDPMSALRHE